MNYYEGDIEDDGGSTDDNGGTGDDSGSTTTYYEVRFALGTGESSDGVVLPETKTYVFGTKLKSLPTPYRQNGIFLGWYYDNDMTRGVEADAVISANMTLYAKMADGVVALSEQTHPLMLRRST